MIGFSIRQQIEETHSSRTRTKLDNFRVFVNFWLLILFLKCVLYEFHTMSLILEKFQIHQEPMDFKDVT